MDVLKFHSTKGALITLSEDGMQARRGRAREEYNNAITFSHRPLAKEEIFSVMVLEKIHTWQGSLEIGLTAVDPATLPNDLPANGASLPQTWILSGSSIMSNSIVTRDGYGCDLNNLARGDVVGVMLSSAGFMHIYLNGVDIGPAIGQIPSNVWAVVDLYGKCSHLSLLTDYVLTQNLTLPLPGDEDRLFIRDMEIASETEPPEEKEENEMPPLRFHSICGAQIRFSASQAASSRNDASWCQQASRQNPMEEFNNGVVVSNRPLIVSTLRRKDRFEVRIDSIVDKWSGSVEIGVMIHDPHYLEELPSTMTNMRSGTIMMSGSNILINGQGVGEQYSQSSLDEIKVGDRLGVQLQEDGFIHFYLNDHDLGPAARYDVQSKYWAVLDLYGRAVAASIFVQGGPFTIDDFSAQSSVAHIVGQSSESSQPLRLNFMCGSNAVVLDDGKRCKRKNATSFNSGVVFTQRDLKPSEYFGVKLTGVVPRWSGSLEVGVTDALLKRQDIPKTMSDYVKGHTIMLTSDGVMYNGLCLGTDSSVTDCPYIWHPASKYHLRRRGAASSQETEDMWNYPALHDTYGLRVCWSNNANKEDRILFYINSNLIGWISGFALPKKLFGVVDLFGQASEVILDLNPVIPSSFHSEFLSTPPPPIGTSPLVNSRLPSLGFHDYCGRDVTLSLDKMIAYRLCPLRQTSGHGLVFSSAQLQPNELFEIIMMSNLPENEFRITLMEFGVVTTVPDTDPAPKSLRSVEDAYYIRNGDVWQGCRIIRHSYSRKLQRGTIHGRIGVYYDSDYFLHVVLNGEDLGTACSGFAQRSCGVYGVFNIISPGCTAVRISENCGKWYMPSLCADEPMVQPPHESRIVSPTLLPLPTPPPPPPPPRHHSEETRQQMVAIHSVEQEVVKTQTPSLQPSKQVFADSEWKWSTLVGCVPSSIFTQTFSNISKKLQNLISTNQLITDHYFEIVLSGKSSSKTNAMHLQHCFPSFGLVAFSESPGVIIASLTLWHCILHQGNKLTYNDHTQSTTTNQHFPYISMDMSLPKTLRLGVVYSTDTRVVTFVVDGQLLPTNCTVPDKLDVCVLLNIGSYYDFVSVTHPATNTAPFATCLPDSDQPKSVQSWWSVYHEKSEEKRTTVPPESSTAMESQNTAHIIPSSDESESDTLQSCSFEDVLLSLGAGVQLLPEQKQLCKINCRESLFHGGVLMRRFLKPFHPFSFQVEEVSLSGGAPSEGDSSSCADLSDLHEKAFAVGLVHPSSVLLDEENPFRLKVPMVDMLLNMDNSIVFMADCVFYNGNKIISGHSQLNLHRLRKGEIVSMVLLEKPALTCGKAGQKCPTEEESDADFLTTDASGGGGGGEGGESSLTSSHNSRAYQYFIHLFTSHGTDAFVPVQPDVMRWRPFVFLTNKCFKISVPTYASPEAMEDCNAISSPSHTLSTGAWEMNGCVYALLCDQVVKGLPFISHLFDNQHNASNGIASWPEQRRPSLCHPGRQCFCVQCHEQKESCTRLTQHIEPASNKSTFIKKRATTLSAPIGWCRYDMKLSHGRQTFTAQWPVAYMAVPMQTALELLMSQVDPVDIVEQDGLVSQWCKEWILSHPLSQPASTSSPAISNTQLPALPSGGSSSSSTAAITSCLQPRPAKDVPGLEVLLSPFNVPDSFHPAEDSAAPFTFHDVTYGKVSVKMALEVRVKPDSYKTVNSTSLFCAWLSQHVNAFSAVSVDDKDETLPNFWITKEKDAIYPAALLVKIMETPLRY